MSPVVGGDDDLLRAFWVYQNFADTKIIKTHTMRKQIFYMEKNKYNAQFKTVILIKFYKKILNIRILVVVVPDLGGFHHPRVARPFDRFAPVLVVSLLGRELHFLVQSELHEGGPVLQVVDRQLVHGGEKRPEQQVQTGERKKKGAPP